MPSALPAGLLPLLVGAALLVGCGDSNDPDASGTGATPAPAVLTEEDDGAAVALRVGESTSLQLDSNWTWAQPEAEGDSVTFVPVDYESDPGFVEWLVEGAAPGTAEVTVMGEPNCAEPTECPQRTVRLDFEVRGEGQG